MRSGVSGLVGVKGSSVSSAGVPRVRFAVNRQVASRPLAWADAHAPDYRQGVNIPLQEFFGNSPSSWRSFTQIPIAACTFQSIGTLQGPDADDE
jgi:hypothetical protein